MTTSRTREPSPPKQEEPMTPTTPILPEPKESPEFPEAKESPLPLEPKGPPVPQKPHAQDSLHGKSGSQPPSRDPSPLANHPALQGRPGEPLPPTIPDIRLERPPRRSSYRGVRCHQCHGYGHGYPECPSVVRHDYCVVCGKWHCNPFSCELGDQRHQKAKEAVKWNLPHQPQQPNPKTAPRATNLSRYQSTEAMPETQPLTNRPIPSRTLSTPAIRPNPSPTPSQVTPTNRGANHKVPVTVYPPSQPPTQSQRLHSGEEVPTQARLGPTRGQTHAESAAKHPRTSPTHHAP
ncbi:pollen-specific leucine-rich repeat extensin-like protein 1 [Diachasma alloeum]|uniref:pollen-specific leucine-rich repeat extensin-like protein 1 n=1 Tax=Diachasma alloeum TaxID=454923 RepID=UPI0007384E86|nr:pollen-specific leucine-rich repeat extensin-like protein 1 [Diachasma alloeum]